MSAMADHPEDTDITRDARMGRAIVRGILFASPICLVGLTLAIWLITDQDIVDSFVTALLPGILLAGFAGGFAGVAATMD